MLSVGGSIGVARADTPEEPRSGSGTPIPAALVAARELFREATTDVDAGRFAVALEKFRRVAAVRDAAPVRYNIGQCEEALGRIGAALADYELAEREAAGDPKTAADVGNLARDRAAALRGRVPRLTLAVAGPPPDGLVVTMDGARVEPGSLGIALPVDPGHHTIDARLAGRGPFHQELDLKEGGSARVEVLLGAPTAAEDGEVPATSEKPSSTRRISGFVVAGVGGALAATSVLFLVLHNNAVTDLKTQLANNGCTGDGRCPPSLNVAQRNDLQSLHDTSARDTTLSAVFAGCAVVAVAAGMYLILSHPAKPDNASAWLSAWPGGVVLNGAF